ncbi:MAG: GvpL/GvpF family gas vesicle protein [Chloroflexi bacterium]|nr:GvpL/GvpF family gas vesicle protein [Chloroflexota bacterium]
MSSTYLYGIIQGDGEALIGIPGVDGVSPVRLTSYGGIGCVLSDYPGGDFATRSREELVRLLLAHQRVVEHVMDDYTVLPVRFGTSVKDVHEVKDMLSQNHSMLLDALEAIHDKRELEVAATWDTNRVLQDIGSEEEVILARERITRKGQPTLEERLQLGQLVKGYMDRHRNSYQERMVASLKPLCVDYAPNALVSDEMVMNVAFLVEGAHQSQFDDAVRQLDRLFDNQITFRIIGPLPPYSFGSVEVTRITSEELEKAKLSLHMDGVISKAEIRKAYRRLAAQEHRMLRRGDELDNRCFETLRQASEILVSWCRVQAETNGQQNCREPAQQGSKNLFNVAIKRVKSEDVEASRFGQVKTV